MGKDAEVRTLRTLLLSNHKLSEQVLEEAEQIESLEYDEVRVQGEIPKTSGIRGELEHTEGNLENTVKILHKIYTQLDAQLIRKVNPITPPHK